MSADNNNNSINTSTNKESKRKEKFQGILAYFETFTQSPLFRTKTPAASSSTPTKKAKQPKTPKTPKSTKKDKNTIKNTPNTLKHEEKENIEEYARPTTPDMHTINKKVKQLEEASLPCYDSDSSYSHATHKKRRQSFTSVRVHKKSARRMTFGSACDISPILMQKHATLQTRPLSWTRGSATPTPVQIRRSLCAGEILQTEENFVSRLELLKKLYIIPLQVDKILSPEEIISIFSNVEIILNVNKALLTDLKELMHDWEDNKIVGDIFVKVIPFLKIYTDYVNNHQAALQAIDTLTAKNADFKLFVERTQKDQQCNGLLLRDFLIDPVQRIPRYELLLRELFKNTPDDHPDRIPLETALEEVKRVATSLNEKNREQKSRIRVIEIHNTLEFPDLIQPFRFLVEEGQLTLLPSRRPCTMYLFNDLLIIAEETERKMKEIDSHSLETAWIVHNSTISEEYRNVGSLGYTYTNNCLDPELGEVPNAVVFEILWPGSKYVFMCKSEEECDKWAAAISGAINELLVKQPKTAAARAGHRLYRDPSGIWDITAPAVAERITKEQYEAQATTYTQQAIQDLINANALAIRSISERKRRRKSGISGVLQRLTPHKSSKYSLPQDEKENTPAPRTPSAALNTPLPTTPQSPYSTPASTTTTTTSSSSTAPSSAVKALKFSTPTRPLQPKNSLADPEPSPRPQKKATVTKDEQPSSPTSPRAQRISHKTKSPSTSPASPRPTRRKSSVGGVQTQAQTLKMPVSALSPRTPLNARSPTNSKTPKKVLFANVSPN